MEPPSRRSVLSTLGMITLLESWGSWSPLHQQDGTETSTPTEASTPTPEPSPTESETPQPGSETASPTDTETATETETETAQESPTETEEASGQDGEIDGPTVIDQPGEYRVTQDIDAGQDPAIVVQADDVTIDGQEHAVSGETGVRADGVANLRIRNLQARGNPRAIHLVDVSGGLLGNLRVVGEQGILMEETTGVRITRSQLSIDLQAASIQGGSNNEVDECLFDIETGVSLVDTTENTVRNNTFRGNVNSISMGQANGNEILDNEVYDCVGLAVLVTGSDDNVFRGNSIQPDRSEKSTAVNAAVALENSNDNTLEENTVTDSDAEGILLTDSTGNTLTSNTLRNNDDGDIVIDGNVIEGNTTG